MANNANLSSDYDIFVVGGGVNGVGIALDAQGRGLKTGLCEMNDLASATSSNSSKLIHGGLRYLEYYEFRLVREALAERETLLKVAPHIMWPMRFRLPHRPHLKPALLIRMGLFLYDNLAKRATLKGSKSISFKRTNTLQSHLIKGFEYSDGWVDDARLVVLNALAAKERGADIFTRTKCVGARRDSNRWVITLKDSITSATTEVTAKAIVNAAGPWVSKFFDESLEDNAPKQIRMVKGSHIVVPKIHDEPEAYILQNEDGRIVFVIPYEQNFSLIGTTDVEHKGDPSDASISKEEIDYLVHVTNEHFTSQITPKDIIHSYSGVRPLLDDEAENPDAVTRDYTFEYDASDSRAPLLSIFGGKITTYRKLAQAAVDKLCEEFPEATRCKTASEPLPGGNFQDQAMLLDQFVLSYPFIDTSVLERYVRTYGTRATLFLKGVADTSDLGQNFGHGLFEVEVNYLIEKEWALTIDDIIWRRTKLGLVLSDSQVASLESFLESVHKATEKTKTA